MQYVADGRYDKAYDLLIEASTRREQLWPLLSTRDKAGNTALDLAASNGTTSKFTQVIEGVVAVVCCDCSVQARRGSICEWIAHQWSDPLGLTSKRDPRRPFKAGCLWGEKMRQRDWLKAETLEEIDDWMLQRRKGAFR